MLGSIHFTRLKAAAMIAALFAVLVVALPAEAATPKCFGRKATIVGTRRGDELRGTNKADVIVAKGGIDLVRARGGNDLICLGGGEIDFAFAGRSEERRV